MDDYGSASPDHYGSGSSIHLVCKYCKAAADYDPDDAEDKSFLCHQCSAVHTSTQATAVDPNDFPVEVDLQWFVGVQLNTKKFCQNHY